MPSCQRFGIGKNLCPFTGFNKIKYLFCKHLVCFFYRFHIFPHCTNWNFLRLSQREWLPEAINQPFDWLKAGFVSHFPTFLNPVTEVEIGQAQGGASGDLPEDTVSAEAGAGDVGVEEGIDGGEAVVETVDQADDAQRAAFRLAGVDGPEQEAALAEPPTTTRAWLRGRLVSAFPGQVVAAGWHSMVLETGERAQRRLPLTDTLSFTRAATAPALKDAADVVEILARLTGERPGDPVRATEAVTTSATLSGEQT